MSPQFLETKPGELKTHFAGGSSLSPNPQRHLLRISCFELGQEGGPEKVNFSLGSLDTRVVTKKDHCVERSLRKIMKVGFQAFAAKKQSLCHL